MKQFISLLMSLLLLTACKQEALTLYIGTYTGKGSAGIYICDFDEKGRNWSIRDSISAVNPSYLALSQDNSLLYAVNETSASSAALQCFSLSGGTPVLKANLLTLGADPCFVCANSALAFTANYTGGNLSVFSLENGVPTSLVQLFPGSASGPDSLRQGEPHLHCALFSPDGDYLFASDFSSDNILIFKVLPDCITYLSSCHLPDGSGVRHLTFHPDGKYLYASHRLESDGISIFRILDGGSALEFLAYEKTGRHPRNFRISPDGRFLFCACRDSDRIDIYEIREGLLYPSGIPSIPISQPVCIEFSTQS